MLAANLLRSLRIHSVRSQQVYHEQLSTNNQVVFFLKITIDIWYLIFAEWIIYECSLNTSFYGDMISAIHKIRIFF